jgi:iron(III) transport system permease protein
MKARALALPRWVGQPAIDRSLLDLLVLGGAVVVVVLLVATPLLTVLVGSFRPGNTLPFDAGEFTLANFAVAFGSPLTLALARNTILFGACSLVLGMLIAITLTWLVERTDMPGGNAIYTIILIPMAIPGLLSALGWVLLLGPRTGVINVWLRNLLGSQAPTGPLDIYTLPGLVWVSGLAVVPTMFIMLSALLRNVNPQFEEAAGVSGAGVFQTARRISVPLVTPGILAVTIYFSIVMIEFFEIPLAIGLNAGLPVLSLQIYNLTRPDPGIPNYGLAGAYSLIGLVLGIALLFWYRRVTAASQKYAVITGKGYLQARVRLGRGRYLALGFVGLYLTCAVVLPFVMLLWVSLLPVYLPPSAESLARVSLANYAKVIDNPRNVLAATNTVILLIASATITMALATLVSWIVTHSKSRLASFLDGLVFLPLAIPSIVIALAVLLAYVNTPLWGTIWILVVGHVIRYLPFAARVMNSAYLQIHRELEEAALVSGATWGTTLRKVVLPLLTSSVVNGWLWVAVHSMRDFTFPLLLISFTNIVITSQLWSLWTYVQHPEVGALSVMLIAASVALAVGSRGVLNRAFNA